MNKAITALLIAACLGTGGCAWMGKTAGRAQASVERGVEDLKTGYDEGYSTEKSRNGKKRASSGTAGKDADTGGTTGAPQAESGKNDASGTAKSDTGAPAGQKTP